MPCRNYAIECMQPGELKKLQEKRFIDAFRRAYINIPYYREKCAEVGINKLNFMDEIQTLKDIEKLPFITKQDLRDTYPYGMFAVPNEQIARVHASSGTTGKQVVAGYTQNDLDIWSECCARALVAAGATANDYMHISYGYGLFTGGFGVHGGAEKLGMTIIPVGTGNTKRQITILKDFGSDYICCTPSYALFIAETMEEMGLTKDDISLKAGLFGAEPWTEEMRTEIEDKLGCKALDIYGLTEIMGPGVAYECEYQCGMHINEDHFLVETIDPDTGEVLPEGSEGELVFTCLTKEAFPLIRYRTRDIVQLQRGERTYSEEDKDIEPSFGFACKCGRTFVKMLKPKGRSDDMLIIRGVNVFPSQIESVLLTMGTTVPYYQIIVDRVNNTDTFDVNVEMTDELFSDVVSSLEEKEREIKNQLFGVLGISANVHLVEPKSIPRTEGKAVRVIDKRKLHG